MMNDWFKDWFDSDEYLIAYKHRDDDDAKKLVSLILNNIDRNAVADVLDLACGSGRHSILLAKEGYNVTGIDLSKNLLNIANKFASESNLKVNFIRSDLRHIKLKQQFDLVLNLFTSFGFFQSDNENSIIFRRAFELTRANGCFVFDFLNREFVIKNLIPYSVQDLGHSVIEQYREIISDRVVKKIIITSEGRAKEFIESVKLYSQDWLKTQLQINGFVISQNYGNYSGEIFSDVNSKRFIAICRK